MTSAARVAALLVAALSITACISLSMFQGPEILDEGQLAGGVGAAVFSLPGDTTGDGAAGFWPELGIRYGLGHDLDFGLKFAGVPPFGTVYGDLRMRFVDAPVPVTFGLGASYAGVTVTVNDSDSDLSFSALYPSVAVGTDRLWLAARGILVTTGSAEDLFSSGSLFGLVAGTSFGHRVRLLPEAELYFGEEPLLGLGLGLQFTLRDGDDGR